jgi:hypothetical protein
MLLAPPPGKTADVTPLPTLSVHNRHAADAPPEGVLGPPWLRATLVPGSALYIPAGYWHAVRTAPGEVSVSVSMFSESAVDRLADAISTLPFDVDASETGAVARTLAVYSALLVRSVVGESRARDVTAELRAVTEAAWKRAGAAEIAEESRYVPGCDATWAGQTLKDKLTTLPDAVAEQVYKHVRDTLPYWQALRGGGLKRAQLRAHIETVAFAGVGGRVESVPTFFRDCIVQGSVL